MQNADDESGLTYVTSFIDIYETQYSNKNAEWRFDRFRKIAETGIQICLYVSIHCIHTANEYAHEFPNIKIMKMITIGDSWVSRVCDQYDTLRLPDNHNPAKDTREYMLLMNAKIEYMYDAIKRNPFKSSHFAWIDFNVSHVFRNMTKCQEKLKMLGRSHLSNKFIAFPGCWNQLSVGDNFQITENIFNDIHWRFCGGFFIGDKESIMYMHELYTLHFPAFIFKYRTLVWEVNFWAWLEAATYYKNDKWSPDWYPGDHDDSILNIPIQFYAHTLSTCINVDISKYAYPEIPNFTPGSAAYLQLPNGVRVINTRYINYTLTPEGRYIFHHPTNKIITRNFSCELNEALEPISFNEMIDPSTDVLLSHECGFQGMEDIRLFSGTELNEIRFSATSIDRSPNGRNSMIEGIYDMNNYTLRDCKVILPDENCFSVGTEKNWVPIIFENQPAYIYSWNPFQIGRIINSRLQIVANYDISSPLFECFRGSTIFIEWKETFIGVVHFSINDSPRNYYHAIVILDKISLKPIKYSSPFCFKDIGIEFCIGFTIVESTYKFWVSRFDREPMLISISLSELPINNNIP